MKKGYFVTFFQKRNLLNKKMWIEINNKLINLINCTKIEKKIFRKKIFNKVYFLCKKRTFYLRKI